ncbi:MAG TPA: DUF4126 domain-containing protein [Candidatus Acidoferrum sp.]|jgi:hypothetical protein
MNVLSALGVVLGTGYSAGLNLYATILTLGLLERFGIIHLPPAAQGIARSWVLAIAAALYFVEFFADKIPYLDSIWDAVHTFIRPPAAALLAYDSVGQISPEWRWAAALLAGGVALTSHSAKASTRAAVNASPEPFSNWALSIGEDLLAVWLSWMAGAHPWATSIVVGVLLLLSAFVIFHLFRFARRTFHRVSTA